MIVGWGMEEETETGDVTLKHTFIGIMPTTTVITDPSQPHPLLFSVCTYIE